MSVKIENGFLTIRIKQKGAELYSIVNKENQLEYMWSGDPAFWGKTSPVLFPIVGALKENTFIYKKKSYTLSKHGFARDSYFELLEQGKQHVKFRLTDNEETLRNYPFHFELLIDYEIRDDLLQVTYGVVNTGSDKMLFSIGAHPAFKVPLTTDSSYDDYYLEFDNTYNADHWLISKEGLIESKSLPLLVDSNRLKLSKRLFYNDALVFKDLESKKISLKSPLHPFGLDFRFEGFPYFGIWAAKDADFVCLEPWCGIADSVNHDQQFETKEGIIQLHPGEHWSRIWSMKFY